MGLDFLPQGARDAQSAAMWRKILKSSARTKMRSAGRPRFRKSYRFGNRT